MTNNFDLRKFLTENGLTKTARVIKEESDTTGHPDHKPTPKTTSDQDKEALKQFNKVRQDFYENVEEELTENVHPLIFDIDYYDNEIIPNLLNKGYIEDEEADDLYTLVRTYKQAVNKNSIDEEVEEVKEETVNESREDYLTRLVENALGITPAPVAEESNDEMVEENPLPKYKNIDELMKNIEYGTNEAAHKYKMNRMKEIADALEAKVTSLEEGENAEHIDQKAVKAMKKDIMTLRKGVEKLEKEYEKKFAKKEKKQIKTKSNIMENNFNLKKFLVENKLTTNSRVLNEDMGISPSTEEFIKAAEMGEGIADFLKKLFQEYDSFYGEDLEDEGIFYETTPADRAILKAIGRTDLIGD